VIAKGKLKQSFYRITSQLIEMSLHKLRILGHIPVVWILWSTSFLIVFTVSLCSPSIPYIIRKFIGEELVVATVLGYLNSTYNLARTLGNVVGGVLTDRLGVARVIMLSVIPFPLSYLLYLISNNWYYILIGESIAGILLGLSFPPFNVAIANLIPKSSRGIGYGLFNLSWILSQILAPLIGGYLSDNVSLKYPFLLSLVISLIPYPLMLYIAKSLSVDKEGSRISLGGLDVKRDLLDFCAINFLNGLSNGMTIPLITMFVMYELSASVSDMGLIFSLSWGLATAIAQVVGGKLADRTDRRRLIMVCVLLSIPPYLLIPFFPDLLYFMVLMSLVSLIGNMASPAYSAWLVDKLGGSKLGKGFGLTSAAFGIGSILGPALGGALWYLFKLWTLLPFLIASLPFLGTLIFVLHVR